MIGKVLRGRSPAGLVYYLFGPGRREEHIDPHIVAGWRHPAELEPPLRADGRRDFRRLNGLLSQPHAALGPRGFAEQVWHCVVRAAPEDRALSDDEWGELARDIMHRTGLSPHGQDDEAVRWIAVRHAPDHIHIVGTLACQDGTRPHFWNDYFRVREACHAAEERYGLRRTAPADRTAGRRATRAENEKARRNGRSEPPRITLRRAVCTAAAGAASDEEFFTRLQDAGVLVRTRLSSRNPGQVTGYAVALHGDTARDGGPVWFSGGKLAADLSLPKLRARWDAIAATPGPVPDHRLTAAERRAIWEHATRTARFASAHIRQVAALNPAAANDAAWAASDTLYAAANALGSRVLRQTADSYARAARVPYARVPPRSHMGMRLRGTARLLAAAAHAGYDGASAPTALITSLAGLIDAVAELRQAQQRAAQAAAAHRAAEHLHAAIGTRHAARPTPPRLRTAADVTAPDFSARRPPRLPPVWDPGPISGLYGARRNHGPGPRRRGRGL